MANLVMAYLTLAELAPEQMVRAAAEGGFRASAIRLTGHRPGDEWPLDVFREAAVAQLAAVARDSGLALTSASSYRFTDQVRPSDYEPVLAACAQLGIHTLVANSFHPDRAGVAEQLHAVAELGKQYGVRVGLEFIPVSKVPSLEDALDVLQQAGAGDRLGLVIDALHLWRSGGGPGQVANVDPALLFSLQLCDAPLRLPPGSDLHEEMRQGRLLPGQGELDLRGLMDAVPAHIELEIEAPNARYLGLPPAQRAREAREAGEAFLASLGTGSTAR
ncbi:MAG: hypothetical protein KER_01690 [Kerstersia gyiorum]